MSSTDSTDSYGSQGAEDQKNLRVDDHRAGHHGDSYLSKARDVEQSRDVGAHSSLFGGSAGRAGTNIVGGRGGSTLGEAPVSAGLGGEALGGITDTSTIVTARGTLEGLVLRVDGRVDRDLMKQALRDFLTVRRRFLAGNEVVIEWVGDRPDATVVEDICSSLLREFEIVVKASRMREAPVVVRERVGGIASSVSSRDVAASNPLDNRESGGGPNLFGGLGTFQSLGVGNPCDSKDQEFSFREVPQGDPRTATIGGEALPWDDADARIVFGTIRSGQRIDTEHTLVVFGDVNSGAEITAGGDIIVLGNLRGVAHAGAYEESGGGRVIFALSMQPTQLRIGLIITRGSGETRADTAGARAEIARVEEGTIVVEYYNSRAPLRRGAAR